MKINGKVKLAIAALVLAGCAFGGYRYYEAQQAAQQAADADVHVVGVSSLAAGHLTLVPALRAALAEVGREDIMVTVGGVIPPGDFQELYDAGAAAIYPPGTVIAEAAIELLGNLAGELGYELGSSGEEAGTEVGS